MDRVLIIEDDKDIAELEKDYLTVNDFDVDLVADGDKGLKKALSGDYSLIIVDVMLPGKDGFKILKEVRDEKEIPVIIVSARTDDIDKIRGLGLGADDYLTKPFSPGELVARVKNNINRYKRLKGDISDSAIIELSGIKINQNSHRVEVRGKTIDFTSKEFELLVFLASNPNIVFSKEKLFNQIWGVEEFGDIATVAVYIQKVRRKIEKKSSDPKIIETVWGSGYRFNA